MTCREVRELLFAFLDSELDAPHSMELQRHLEHCGECAREAEIERTVRKHLESRLGAPGSIPAFDEAVIPNGPRSGAPDVSAGQPAAPRRRSFLGLGIAAAAMLALTLLGWLYASSARRSSLPLADVLIADFQHVLQEDPRVQMGSADALAVSSWLRERTNLPVEVPATHGLGCKLLGARKCTIQGRTAALALYDMNGTPASLVAMNSAETDLQDMQARSPGYWLDRCKGYTVVACTQGALTYVAVGQLPEENLLHLIQRGAGKPPEAARPLD